MGEEVRYAINKEGRLKAFKDCSSNFILTIFLSTIFLFSAGLPAFAAVTYHPCDWETGEQADQA